MRAADLYSDLPPALTVEEARQALQVGRRQLYGLIHDGALHAVRVGSVWRIPRHALLAFLGVNGKEEAPAVDRGPDSSPDEEDKHDQHTTAT